MFSEDFIKQLFQHQTIISTGRKIHKVLHSDLLFLHIGWQCCRKQKKIALCVFILWWMIYKCMAHQNKWDQLRIYGNINLWLPWCLHYLLILRGRRRSALFSRLLADEQCCQGLCIGRYVSQLCDCHCLGSGIESWVKHVHFWNPSLKCFILVQYFGSQLLWIKKNIFIFWCHFNLVLC